MEQISYDDFKSKYAQYQTMKDIEAEFKRDVEDALFYNHNGADVAVIEKRQRDEFSRGKRHDYDVIVFKNDNVLRFYAGGEIGNEAGTLFVRAGVVGLPFRDKADENSSKGIYPYTTILKDEQEKKGVDVLVAAGRIYDRYQDETNGNVKIGDIFKQYVPDSFEGMKKRFEATKQQTTEQQKQSAIDVQIKSFKDNLGRF